MLNWLKQKQNQDPTLHEKSWGLYRLGRFSSWSVLIVGTIISLILATWVGNALQTLFAVLLNTHVGLFSGSGTAGQFAMTHLFSLDAFVHDEYLLDHLAVMPGFFATHGKAISGFLRIIAFALLEFITFRIFLDLFVKSRNLNHHEYGASRIATPKEVADETNRVPDRTYYYDVPTGAIMMHKMNIRGAINKTVKQQMFGLKNYFHLTPEPSDPSDRQEQKKVNFKNFILASNGTMEIIALFLIIGGIIGKGQKVVTGHAPFYSPYWLWVVLYDIVHFIIRGLFNLVIDLLKAQLHLFMAVASPNVTLALAGLIIEALVIGLIVYRILAFTRTNYRYNTSHKLKHAVKTFRTDPSIAKQAVKKKMHKHHDLRYYGKALARPLIYIKDSIGHPKHTSHPFFKKPLLAIKLAIFTDINNWLPLDSGITGWYYTSAGGATQQNELVYGITRSGKGQMLVNTLLELNSRANMPYRKNLIINDPKLELAAGMYETLKRRGYDVKILNINDTSRSMSYNPLALVIKQTILGDTGKAATDCSELSSTIYDSTGQGQNSYFYKSAANLFDAIVFAQLSLAHSRYYGLDNFITHKSIDHGKTKTANVHEDGRAKGHFHKGSNGRRVPDKLWTDKKGIVHSSQNAFSKVTINNILQMTTQLGGEQAQQAGDGAEGSNQLIIYFQHLSHQLVKLRRKKQALGWKLSNTLNDQLNILDQAAQKFQQSKMAGGKTAGSIYSTFLERLRIYQQPNIARMTSMNNYNIDELGFDRLLTIQFSRALRLQNVEVKMYDVHYKHGVPHGKDSQMTTDSEDRHHWIALDANGQPIEELDNDTPIETHNTHLSDIGLAKIPFDHDIPHDTFYIKIKIFDERVHHHYHFTIKCHKRYYTPDIYERIHADYREAPKVGNLTDKNSDGSPIKDRKTGKPIVVDKYTHKKVLYHVDMTPVQMPAKAEYLGKAGKLGQLANDPEQAIRRMHFLDNPRPTALFLGTTTDNEELNQLATFLVNQTFNVLSNEGLHFTKSRHIQRSLQMILDELGNIPAIPNLDKKFSIGLSQHIEFVAIFQNKEQITNKYGKDKGASIISNCSTTYYILSKSDDTLKEVSAGFGNRTITTTSLNHDPTRVTSANYNSNEMKQPVMSTDKLRHLKIGECAILRSNDRQTAWGKDSINWPLFDTGKYILPYSFWFLGKYIKGGSVNSIPIVTPHKYLDLEAVTIQFNKVYGWLESKECLDHTYLKTAVGRLNDKFDKIKSEHKLNDNYASAISKEVEVVSIYAKDRTHSATSVLQLANRINDTVDEYVRLAQLPKATAVADFALHVFKKSSSIKDLEMLSNESDNNNGTSLMSEVSFAIEDASAKTQKQSETRSLFSGFQSVFGGKQSTAVPTEQKFDNLADQINNVTISKSANAFATGNLSGLRIAFDKYLSDTGIVHTNKDLKPRLTVLGKKILENRKELVGQISSNGNHIEYEPVKPLSKMLDSVLNSFVWAERYGNDFGLALAMAIINRPLYKDFCTYKDKNGNPAKARLTAIVYIQSIISLLDVIIHFDVQNGKIEIQYNKVSKACTALNKQIIHIDNQLDSARGTK